MPNLNSDCDGAHCATRVGEVRVYPLSSNNLGGGSNLILCRWCWSYENMYRIERGRDTGSPENFPLNDWKTAEVYDGQQ